MVDFAFYREYRPKMLHQIVGQEQATDVIKQSCVKEKFHHAYLLYGPFGTGKTTAARVLAAILTCENREVGSFVTCGKCLGCRTARAGGGIDIREMDSGGIEGKKDEIVGMINSSRFSPQELKRRVFIIDEFHGLSAGAMRALLKPIEEPPPHVTFILCTTDYRKVPPAISSRCQRLLFRPIPDTTISFYLEKLSQHVGIDCEKEACVELARSSRGCMRTALNLLEMANVSCDGGITGDAVRSMLGLGGRDSIYALFDAITAKNAPQALAIADKIFLSVVDLRALCYEMSEIIRMIGISVVGNGRPDGATESEWEKITQLAGTFTANDVTSIAGVFNNIVGDLEINLNPRLVFQSLVLSLIHGHGG